MPITPDVRSAAPYSAAAPARPEGASSDGLTRTLGFWATMAVVVGTIIGSGIFRVPAGVAAETGSVAGIATVWILGGIITMCGALAIAELAAAFPRTGGVYVYLREAYGPLIAFLYGWTLLLVSPAGAAGIALVFAEYLGVVVPMSQTGIRAVAAVAIIVVATAGYRSVRGAGAIQSVATAGKVAALAALVVTAFVFGDGSAGSVGQGAPLASEARWGGIGLGLVAALWADTGFQDMLSVAGEVRDPARVLPRALILGTITVVVIYLAANAAYIYVLPFDALRGSALVASDTMVRAIGAVGAGLVASMVMISTFGALNGIILVNPRVFYAMASEGLLFRPLARVHPRFGTPHIAVATYAGFALIGVWSRTFEQLAEAFVLGVWPFLALTVAAVMVLRRTRPELVRPYRMPGSPVVPIVFILATLGVVASALIARPVSTLWGMALTVAGIPVYLIWRRMDRRRAVASVT